MTGRSAYYCEKIALAGLIVIHTVASPRSVAPSAARGRLLARTDCLRFSDRWRSSRHRYGHIGVHGNDLQFRARLGVPIPEGVALGPNGHPTTDANAARRGALLPFGGPEGGYKGFGLASPWTRLALGRRDATRGRREWLYVHRLKPTCFCRRGLPARSHQAIDMIKATPRQMVWRNRIPGERGYRTRARLMLEGIEIDRKIYNALGRLAEGELDHGG